MKKILTAITILLIISPLAGCKLRKDNPQNIDREAAIKVGGILIMTGKGSNWGVQALRGAQIANEEIGSSLSLIVEDSQYDTKLALSAFEKLTSVDHVDGIVSMGSGMTLAIAPKLEDKKVIAINAGAVSPKLSGASKYLFNIVPLSTQDSKFIADQAYQKLDYRRVAMISSNDEASAGATQVFQEEFTKLGGVISADEKFLSTDNDYRTYLLKTQKENPDAIFTVGTSLGAVIKQAREMGIKQPFISNSPFELPDNITQGGQAVEGVVYSNMKLEEDSPEFQTFQKKYRDKFKTEPSLYSYTAYDCVKLLYAYLSDCKKDLECVRNKLLTNRFSGLTSNNIIFDEKGEIQSAMQLKTVKDGQFVKYEE